MAFDAFDPADDDNSAFFTINTVDLEGLKVANGSQESALDWLAEQFENRSSTRVAFMNAHCFNVARKDPYYRSSLRRMDALLPDGSGISTGAKLKGEHFEANLNGTDFIPALFKRLSDRPVRLFLLGGRPGVAEAAATRITQDHPLVSVVGTKDGFFAASDSPQVVEQINASNADIVLVAMGVPTQERWIDRNALALRAPLVFGVGALLDFLAERVSRAPNSLRKLGLEWTWRLAQEPHRMWQRYVVGNPIYLAAASQDAARHYLRTWHGVLGRALDFCVGASGLLLTLPILLPAMLAIKVTSSGPVFFKQTRIGEGGRPFTMLKLRSMYQDADRRLAEVREQNHHGSEGVTFKCENDPRITAIGRLIRKYSIDELPQFINVLRGDMAAVGPRPPLPSEVARYSGEAWQRLSVKPGLTCFWQIGGRAQLAFDEQVRLDLLYINTRDVITDLSILLKTPLAVLKGEGAC